MQEREEKEKSTRERRRSHHCQLPAQLSPRSKGKAKCKNLKNGTEVVNDKSKIVLLGFDSNGAETAGFVQLVFVVDFLLKLTLSPARHYTVDSISIRGHVRNFQ